MSVTVIITYDLAGNLVKTVPPKGVAAFDEATAATIPTARNGYSGFVSTSLPSHTMATRYQYNTLNQLVWQDTPDGGETTFYYDELGRLILSQNARQVSDNQFSYTLYDALGRIQEAGELTPSTTIELWTNYQATGFTNQYFYLNFEDWIVENQNVKEEVVQTYYDEPLAAIELEFTASEQENVRNRVASVTYDLDGDGAYESASHYSYDIHGNVHEYLQENTYLSDLEQDFKRVTYDYDLISGNVKQVDYQQGEIDAFHHRYRYDADNRIVLAETSSEETIWDRDAKYFYYAHGPLARVELGEKQVNAEDYVYTINGWLKGVNSNSLRSNRDVGRDGKLATNSSELNEMFATDAIGFSLNYFEGDYNPIESPTTLNYAWMNESFSTDVLDESPDLFNGNIARMITAHSQEETNVSDELFKIHVNAYRYDQLQRIRRSRVGEVDFANSSLANANLMPSDLIPSTTKFNTAYTYDRNGNILTLSRNGDNGLMDDFAYSYHYEDISCDITNDQDPLAKNQLTQVVDLSATPALYDNDHDGNSADNYKYDGIGQLTEDEGDAVSWIEWTVQNKIKRVVRHEANGEGDYLSDLEFIYDPLGNRVAKIEKPRDTSGNLMDQSNWTYNIYVRDASGNTMTTYKRQFVDQLGQSFRDEFKVSGHEIYGSKRLGTSSQLLSKSAPFTLNSLTPKNYSYSDASTPFTVQEPVFYSVTYSGGASINSYDIGQSSLGFKNYELSNHLGNVLAIISDVKTPVGENVDGTAQNYTPRIINLNDYYPFGMQMPGRGYDGGEYRYGFQGQETDKEWLGGAVSYKYRVHDARIGRFLSLDPLAPDYPHNSPYAFSENMVIHMIELEGLEAVASEANSGGQNSTNPGIPFLDFSPSAKAQELMNLAQDSWDMAFDFDYKLEFSAGLKVKTKSAGPFKLEGQLSLFTIKFDTSTDSDGDLNIQGQFDFINIGGSAGAFGKGLTLKLDAATQIKGNLVLGDAEKSFTDFDVLDYTAEGFGVMDWNNWEAYSGLNHDFTTPLGTFSVKLDVSNMMDALDYTIQSMGQYFSEIITTD